MGLFFCEFFPHERIIRSRRLYFPVWEGRELNIPLPSASFHSEKSVLHFSSLGLGTVVVELCSEVQHFLLKMASVQLYLKLVGLALLLTMLSFQDVSSERLSLHKILKRSDGTGITRSKAAVAVPPAKAQEFLAKLSRTKRHIWDRNRPDVQQWIMQFMYMGYDEQVCSRAL